MSTIGLDSSGSRQGSLAISCEDGNGYLGSIECVEFLDQMSDLRCMNFRYVSLVYN
jgi:hypothetical protein